MKRWLATAAAGLLLCGQPLAAAAPTHQGAGALSIATADQDSRFARAFAEVDNWVAQKAFPGAVLAVGQHGRLIALKAFGRMSTAPDAPPMATDTIFDLASLTKVIGTTTAAAILYDREKLDLDATVTHYLHLPAMGGATGHDAITVRELLTHSSGLTPTRLLYQQATDKAGILWQIEAMQVTETPGTVYHYRDENMILMGEIVEHLWGGRLDSFLENEVFAPLGMTDTGYRPSPKLIGRIAPTEQDDTFRHMLVRGVVHDENAWVMGGVSGHAGLFSTAPDLAKFAQFYLNGGIYHGVRLLRPDTVALFMRPQSIPPGSPRALGWDMAVPGSFAGPLASPHAIIHTGFTGTSIYIDPDRDAFIILLTNRVNPTRTNTLITQARPAIHTAVLAALDGSKPAK
jgi:CubicO group peptidase (beta-lactamase class C family)